MKIGLPEVRDNAAKFAARWKDVTEERAEAQSFWNELFAVFGMSRSAVASFEEPIKNLKGGTDRIDVFWKGVMMGEHKSAGRDLSKAASQAMGYLQNLAREGRGHELPRYLVVSDFSRIKVYDLSSGSSDVPIADFRTEDLPKHFKALLFLGGEALAKVDRPEESVDIEAVELLGALHDELERGGFAGTALERLLVRVLFCLFAEDTGIFDDRVFSETVRTARPDGSDLGPLLSRLFQVLDQPREARSAKLPQALAGLPYVNGALFHGDFGFAEFDGKMLAALQRCCELDWGAISPAIFGSLFQSVMLSTEGKKVRRQAGAHYTSERDILRVIGPLFLDELKAELARAGTGKRPLGVLHERIAGIRILDPACGCGNFLVVAYRELRRLEHEILRRLHGDRIEPDHLKVRIEQVNGIEINEWPARIAEVAMFLIEHQMDEGMRALLPKFFTRLPIRSTANIRVGNALRIDWNEVLPAGQCTYVLGNPPFVGAKWQGDAQRDDMAACAGGVKNYGLLDYVCGWYFKATEYTRESKARCAFVSTNSISQGEQVGVLWNELFARGARIHFAHRTFEWQSEARGEAHVHVVIVGFGLGDVPEKMIFDYPSGADEPVTVRARNISPYLVEGKDFALVNRSSPLCDVPPMVSGNQPIDDGNYLFTPEERAAFIAAEPKSERFFKRWLGGEEFINGIERWYLHLVGCDPAELRSMPSVCARIDAVRKFRLASRRASTVKLGATPTRFQVEFSPNGRFLAVPEVSSERREYIPIAYLDQKNLPGNTLRCVADASEFELGVLSSLIHMAWLRSVAGRLEMRYRYSAKLVYNNFPWPQNPDAKAKAAVESAAQAVLEARAAHPTSTLADLYDPLTMPPDLRAAHQALDKAVDRCYRPQPFTSERERVEFLFDLHLSIATPLAAAPKRPVRRKKAPDEA